MVRPGLFLYKRIGLTKRVLRRGFWTLIAAAAAVSPSWAERSVGLDAQGVDARHALENPYGLDLRDELGRPVSSKQIARELKAASAEAMGEAAEYASRLPQAAKIVPFLELLAALTAALRLPALPNPLRAAFALAPGSGPQAKRPPPALPFLLPVLAICCSALFLPQLSWRPACLKAVLRC